MTKDILLSIKGLQFIDEINQEPIEIVTRGSYLEKDGRHYIKYDEVLEGLEGSIQNLIKLNQNSMEVTKRGATNVHMLFEEDKKNMSYYSTPFGNLLIGISATSVLVNTDTDRIDVQVEYALEVNHEHISDCSISMNIMSTDIKEAHLF